MENNITGARRIGETWHYNIRVPKRLSAAYDLSKTIQNYKGGFIRGTMRTKCPDQATRLARAALAELDKLTAKLDSIAARIQVFDDLSESEKDKLDSDLGDSIAKLPTDQKQLLEGVGGVWGAGHKWKQYSNQAAFLEAGFGSEFDLKELHGEDFTEETREDTEAVDRFTIERTKKKADKYEKALAAAGAIEPTANAVTGLRALLDKFCEAKGYIHTPKARNKTRGQYEYAVRRFVEYHGDLPLADLTRKHLSDFGRDFLKLPTSSRRDIRPLAFHDAVRVADKEGLTRASARTRNQNLTLLKALLTYAVKEGDRENDPWAGYTPTVAKQKISERNKNRRHVFTHAEVKRITAYTSKNRGPDTIDHWAPLFGAFHGLRIEEVCQMRVADVVEEEGLICIKITDEGEGQRVKNANTFRTIPVHAGLLKLGFGDFVNRRRKAGGNFLFMVAERWGGNQNEIAPDGQGRRGAFYGSRFSHTLRKLKIEGYQAGYHSFRHAWTDLARNAGIDPEKRRALAGRDSDADGVRIDGTEDRYGHGYGMKELAVALNKLHPLD